MDEVAIIDILQTYVRAAKVGLFLREWIFLEGYTVLFVGTNKAIASVVAKNACKASSYYIHDRWKGGFLTNFETMKNNKDFVKKYFSTSYYDYLLSVPLEKFLEDIKEFENEIQTVSPSENQQSVREMKTEKQTALTGNTIEGSENNSIGITGEDQTQIESDFSENKEKLTSSSKDQQSKTKNLDNQKKAAQHAEIKEMIAYLLKINGRFSSPPPTNEPQWIAKDFKVPAIKRPFHEDLKDLENQIQIQNKKRFTSLPKDQQLKTSLNDKRAEDRQNEIKRIITNIEENNRRLFWTFKREQSRIASLNDNKTKEKHPQTEQNFKNEIQTVSSIENQQPVTDLKPEEKTDTTGNTIELTKNNSIGITGEDQT